MPDSTTVDNGALPDYIVSDDDTPSGKIQRIKLAYSADASDAMVPADGNGLAVNVTKALSSTTGSNAPVTVTTTVTLLVAASTTRKTVNFRPAATIYWGYTNTITTSTGFPLYANEVWEEPVFKGAIYAIAATGTVDVRVADVT